ncbi:hypothetical protein JR316_0005780 [Psilocybe cubensis]|uniref:Uncharacterized protein n=2 Tax=Psilocybe cubensis TaxID=181762 RepID=A0ACB8H0E8_PSICU|nr:hypothetical protein JR316_0005780 [Psilocybe cubensis]KAH9481258.1 hypothetical protein JR316_0005780 [Psilocybe cubensis]
MSSTKIGIAIYAQQGTYNRPRPPHWALVLHPTSYSAPDVRVYHIRGRNGVWTLGHDVRELQGMGDLMGVLHIADIPPERTAPLNDNNSTHNHGQEHIHGEPVATTTTTPAPTTTAVQRLSSFQLDDLDAFIQQFPATKQGDDPSKLFVWTCESYVIRVLAYLSREGALQLPCVPEEMYDYTRRRIAVLKALPRDGDGICIVPFAE